MQSTIRTIDSIECNYDSFTQKISIRFIGKSFLRYMVRRLVGVAVQYATRSDITIESIQDMLHSGQPGNHFAFTAPAKGLILQSITFKELL